MRIVEIFSQFNCQTPEIVMNRKIKTVIFWIADFVLAKRNIAYGYVKEISRKISIFKSADAYAGFRIQQLRNAS